MTKTTTNLLGILITILAGTMLYMTLCSSCGVPEVTTAVEPAVVPTTLEATSYPFAFSDGDYAYNESDNYNFNMSSSSILMPLSGKVTSGVTSLKSYLLDNSGKVINITGYYSANETNSSAYPDLGMARANAVKNHLVQNGVSSAQINTMGMLKEELVPRDAVYLGPIAYSLSGEAANSEAELSAILDRIKADPLILYFETNQTSIELTAQQRQKVADISRYLDKVPGSTCNVQGHTDNVGERTSNIALGQDRADFAKSYLIKNGIEGAKIITSSKGPDTPIESNATEAGRAKNRRTVVTFN
tara:strand:- start:7146 stop:8051 length:906 start_codon:yes stop_codon:yes gene_type:complete